MNFVNHILRPPMQSETEQYEVTAYTISKGLFSNGYRLTTEGVTAVGKDNACRGWEWPGSASFGGRDVAHVGCRRTRALRDARTP